MKYKDYLKYWQDIASEKGYEESAILLLLLYEAKLTSSELYMKMDDEIDKKISDNFETDVKKYLDEKQLLKLELDKKDNLLVENEETLEKLIKNK